MIAPLLLLAALSNAPETPPPMRIDTDARRRTISLEIGPVWLAPTTDYRADTPPVVVAGQWGVHGWLRSFRVEVVDERGEVIPFDVVHHAALIAPEDRELFRPIARRIVAFGRETESIRLPGELGYRVEPDDSLRLVASFFNPGERPLEVRLRLIIQYADAQLDVAHRAVLPFYLDAGGEGPSGFEVPPGGVRQSFDWSPTVSGRVLALGGHLHEHGVALIVEDVTEGRILWTGKPVLGPGGELRGVTRKFFLRGMQLRADHVYRITAVYENPTDEVIGGAMGHVGGLFIPDDSAQIPSADRTNPEYASDEYGTTQSPHHHHHP